MGATENIPTDPVTGIAQAVSDFSLLITKAIPSDEYRMQQLHNRSPKIYARLRMWMLNKCRRHLRLRWREDIDSYVELTAGAFLQTERDYMKKLLHADLQR